jgi:hypothetical protein
MPNIIGIVYHWSGGKYDQIFSDYHYNIIFNQKTLKAEIVKTCKEDTDILSHTWHRNTGRIGVSLSCCYNATTNNLGSFPPTVQQIELACSLCGKLINKYKIPKEEVRTHAEWALEDGYGVGSLDPETRWDLWIPNWKGKGKNLSVVMRDKSLWYAKQLTIGTISDPEKTSDLNLIISEMCEKYNLSEKFVKALIKKESSWNEKAVSSSGAKGLMQLMPVTFKECLQKIGLPENSDIFNPRINIECGTFYLDWISKQIEKPTGDCKAIYFPVSLYYNAGIGKIKNGEISEGNLIYANKIMRYMNEED